MDQPRLSSHPQHAVAALNASARWEWPYGWVVSLSYRREGERQWVEVRKEYDDASAVPGALQDLVAEALGLL